jgi:hypothetical protein
MAESKKPAPKPAPREYMLVGLFALLPQSQRTRAYYVTLGVVATVFVIGIYREPIITAFSVPGLGAIGWFRAFLGRI